MYFFTFLFGKPMWMRVSRLWLSKTFLKSIVDIVKVQDNLLKTNQRHLENILFFGLKYV